MKLSDLISQFCDDLSFDSLKNWCSTLNVEYEEPACDDDWPNWENDLRGKLKDAFERVGK